MRLTMIGALVAVSLSACGGGDGGGGGFSPNDLSGGGGGGNDLLSAGDLAMAQADLSMAPDMAQSMSGDDGGGGNVDTTLPGVQCGKMTCPMGQVCCADPNGMTAKCTAANACIGSMAAFACDGPEDCGGNAKFCCTNLMLGGNGANCTFMSATAVCRADCPAMFNLCPTTEQAKLCHKGADCAGDANAPNCCELSSGSGPAIIACVPDLVKQFTNPKCY